MTEGPCFNTQALEVLRGMQNLGLCSIEAGDSRVMSKSQGQAGVLVHNLRVMVMWAAKRIIRKSGAVELGKYGK